MKLLQGDCLELMKDIPDGSVDMILTDPPYGTTACKWDSVIPFEPMWERINKLIKPNGAIVLFGSQPFTSALIMSNVKMFKYEWVWQKTMAGNFFNANKEPMKKHENILVFYKKPPQYNPQMSYGKPYSEKKERKRSYGAFAREKTTSIKPTINKGTRYPSTVQLFSNGNNKNNGHPTQKPVPLLEYLIKTYTNETETVLDFTMGSGSTGVACKNLNRDFIGIEKEPDYFKIAEERIGQ